MKENQNKKPILTISMLSSNRRDTIRKCLDSLKTLRERVSSELIIVDTAHDEEMKKILLEYTDQIIPFTWCNDFSKARNVGLDAANGEWFLYLDDDEWFIDTKEIEDFFLSGMYKEYTLAYYLQRNYADFAGTSYNDVRVSRMFRIWNNVRFVSSIHEYPYPLSGKSKLLHSAVEHYGYVYDTEEKRYQHFQRNVPLLRDMIQKERKNPRWWLQLIQEYRCVDQYPELQKCCEEALEIFTGINNIDVDIARGSFYNGIIWKNLKFYEYANAEKVLKQALADQNTTQMCKAALYNSAANIYFHNKDYELCEDYCRKYLKIYEALNGNDEEIYKQGFFFVDEAFNLDNVEQLFCIYMSCGMRKEPIDTTALREYFWKLGWRNKYLYLESSFVSDVINAFGKLPYEEEFVKMAAAMIQRDGIDAMVADCMQKKEKDELEEFARLERIFLQMPGNQIYIVYLKLINAKDIADIEIILAGIGFYKWKVAVDYLCSRIDEVKDLELQALLDNADEKYGAYRDYFMLRSAEIKLCRHDKQDYDGLRECIRSFCRNTYTFFSRFFKETAFTGEMEMLPVQGRIAVHLGNALEAEAGGNIKEASAFLKKCLDIYPPLNEVIRIYSVLFAEKQKERLKAEEEEQKLRQQSVNAQMQLLAIQIKDKIRVLLGQNLIAEAQQALEQLKLLLPDDQELIALEAEIRQRLS